MKKFIKVLAMVLTFALVSAIPTACSLGLDNGSTTNTSVRHTVTFETNGGSVVNKKRVVEGNTISEPITTKEGYTFVGWYEDADFNNAFNFTEGIYENLTLYAKWEVEQENQSGENAQTFTITYHFCDGMDLSDGFGFDFLKTGANGTATQTCNKGKGAIVNLCGIYDGNKRFGGWYYDAAYQQPYQMGTVLHNNCDLYAKWNAGSFTCKIYFNADGGKYNDDKIIKQGSIDLGWLIDFDDDEIEIPTREGYQFQYWYYKPMDNPNFDWWYCEDWNENGPIIEDKEFNFQVATDIMLYAKWKQL